VSAAVVLILGLLSIAGKLHAPSMRMSMPSPSHGARAER
jgi:hypothetical protein